MDYVSVADAAQRLGVSGRRVRQLLEDRSLQGVRVGGSWLVAADELERRQQLAPPSGRPLSSASAWNVLAALAQADEGLKHLSPSLRSRACSRAMRLRHQTPEVASKEWRSTLRRRAHLHQFYGHPSILADLVKDPEIVRSGISAAHDHGANLMVVGGAEGYIRARDLSKIVERYALSPASGRDANVWLHVVGDEADWLFNGRVAPAPVVAADLVERHELRDQMAGAKLAASL
jgi:excisionase family DNA binding protein